MPGNPNPSPATRWKKGQRGGPGRPKGSIEAYVPDFNRFRPLTDHAVARVTEMMDGYQVLEIPDKNGTVKRHVRPISAPLQLAACVTVLERAWGKAPQALHIRNETPDEIDDEKGLLEAIQSRLNGIAARIGAAGILEFTDIEPAP